MSRRVRLFTCWLLVAVAVAVGAGAFGLFIDHTPAGDATEAAQEHAREQGYPVFDGYFAYFVTQPDTLGGCEVECRFGMDPTASGDDELVARVRRSWVYGSWRVTEMTPRKSERARAPIPTEAKR